MKKFFVSLLFVIIVLLFAACDNKTAYTSCLNCGSSISHSGAFCSNCGIALNTTENKGITTSQESTTNNAYSTGVVTETNIRGSTQLIHSHSYSVATCTTPAKCSCGATDGGALGHSYDNGKCSRCGVADSNYVTHSHFYSAATCTTPAKCSCGATDGGALGHSYDNGKCSRCGTADSNNVAVETILFDKISLSMMVGDTDALGVTVYPHDATNQILYWESSDTDVVTVDAMGKLAAKSYGSATISAHSENGVYAVDCQVVVKENPILTCNDFPLHLYSYDDKDYLGKLVTNKYDGDSIWNEYGTYGSKYQTNSIWNEYGKYGSKHQSTSAFNPYASQPPKIVTNSGKVLGYLSANEHKLNGYTIIQLERALKKVGQ